MSYRLNQPGMFAVPNSVADEHLKLAGALQLKALLWILRRGGAVDGLEAVAHWLGKPEGDLVDALQFWIDRGIIAIDNAQCAMRNAENEREDAPVKPAPPPLPPVRPTATQVLTRTDEDGDLRGLFREADKILGRTIGYEGQCMLLMLHDTYGLPPDVIAMLLHYCAEIGKTNNGYIEAVGRDWGQREIDTIEEAGAQIAGLKQNLSLWDELRRRAGLHAPRPTAAQCEHLRRWSGELGFGIDMVYAAYEEMAERTGKLSFSYMNKVLEGWHAAGVKTPEQATAAKAEFQQKKQKPAQKKSAGAAAGYQPSFDLEAFERSTLEVPVFEK